MARGGRLVRDYEPRIDAFGNMIQFAMANLLL